MAAKSVTCPLCQKRILIEGKALEEHYMAELASLQATTDQGSTAGSRLSTRRADRAGSGQFDKAIEELRARRLSRTTGSGSDGQHNQQHRNQEVHHPRCFMCGITLPGEDLEAVNAHIDSCLGGGSQSTPTSEAQGSSGLPSAEGEMEAEPSFLEYTWAGETRIRATALSESISRSSSGSALSSGSSSRAPAEVDEGDVNVDDDDTQQYGDSQYGERDLEIDMMEEEEEELEAEGIGEDVTLQEGNPTEDMPQPTAMAEGLVIQSLKARIRELEHAYTQGSDPTNPGPHGETRRRGEVKCLICMDGYQKPTVSIVCWHTHCEACWLQSLRAKKLCPQCQKITLPSDLRRIYL
ncbi:MAG: hypothetical protein DHS80DRAFT_32072 [Piptocephalis tieghemiana]|nr:MAG: hypothetical protein DHS80DRAFT_32072 [Piptocephalis tieghemiana]